MQPKNEWIGPKFSKWAPGVTDRVWDELVLPVWPLTNVNELETNIYGLNE